MKLTSEYSYLSNYKSSFKWVVFLFSFLLYVNTINHGLALDDYTILVENKHVQAGFDGIGKILTTNYHNGFGGFNAGLYRPMSPLSFAIENELFNNNTQIAHLINMLLYAFCGLLLYLCLKGLLIAYSPILPLLISLLFMAHPLHTEVVANIKGRDELFAFLGFLVTLYSLLIYITDKNKKFLLLGLLAYLFALFSKESAVTFSLAIPVLLFFHPNIKWRSLVPISGVLLLLALAFMGLRMYIISTMSNPIDTGNFGLLNNPIAATDDFFLRYGTAFRLQLLYLQKLLFPYPLIHDYSYNLIPLVGIFNPLSLLGIGILISLVVIIVRGIVDKNYYAIAALFFLLTISVGSQLIITIGTTFAERLLFVPSLSFCLIVIFLIYQFFKGKKGANKIKAEKKTVLLSVPIILLFGSLSIDRNVDWKNNLTLYSADIEAAKESARANYNLGSALMNESKNLNNANERKLSLKRSAEYLNRAITIYPEYLDAYNNLGIVYKMMNQPAKAIRVLKANIKNDPNYSKNYYNLATAYAENKQFQNAILSMQAYVDRNPNNADAYFLMGQYAGNINDFEQAIVYLNQALAIEPKNAAMLNFLGMAYGFQGKNQIAIATFKKVLILQPNKVDVMMNLALAYQNINNQAAAISTLNSVLKIDPNNQRAKQHLLSLQ